MASGPPSPSGGASAKVDSKNGRAGESKRPRAGPPNRRGPVEFGAMNTPPSPPLLVLWRGDGCHLCDEAAELLTLLLAERARAGLPIPAVELRRIADAPAAERAFFELIPVLEMNGVQLPLALRAAQVRAWLSARLDTPPSAPA